MFEFFGRAMRSGLPRQQPVNWVLHRGVYESAGLLYHLRAQVDCKTIGNEESKASKWQWTT